MTDYRLLWEMALWEGLGRGGYFEFTDGCWKIPVLGGIFPGWDLGLWRKRKETEQRFDFLTDSFQTLCGGDQSPCHYSSTVVLSSSWVEQWLEGVPLRQWGSAPTPDHSAPAMTASDSLLWLQSLEASISWGPRLLPSFSQKVSDWCNKRPVVDFMWGLWLVQWEYTLLVWS